MADAKLIANRYEVQATIGEFPNATLYRTWDTAAQQGVMLSVGNTVTSKYHETPYTLNERRFMGLLHPHLVRVIHFGVHEKRRYLVMPVLPGQPLAAYLSNRQEPYTYVQRWATALGSALVYLHNEGIEYHKIAPENIWLDDQYNVLLLPIPTPIPAHQSHTDITHNLKYLAPEQMRGEAPNSASDQYTLAVIMYQIITGELPYLFDNPSTYMVSVTTGVPLAANELRADIPPAMNTALMKALSKQAQNRYPSITDFIDAFLPDEFFDPSITDTGTFIQVDDDRFGTQETIPLTDEEVEEAERQRDQTRSESATSGGDIDLGIVEEEAEEWFAEDDDDEKITPDELYESGAKETVTKAISESDNPATGAAEDIKVDEQSWIDKIKEAIDDATDILLKGLGGNSSEAAPEPKQKKEEKSASDEGEASEEPAPEKPDPQPALPGQSVVPPVPRGGGIAAPAVEIEHLQQRRSELMAQLLVKQLMRDQTGKSEMNAEIRAIEAEIADLNRLIPAQNQQSHDNLKTAQAQFTAYYSRTTVAETPYGLYIYAHVPDALRQVSADVENFAPQLGGTIPQPKIAGQSPQLQLGINLTVVVEIDKIEFEPVAITKKWNAPFTRFDFAYTAPKNLVDDIISGRISVQVNGLEIAHIPFATLVEAAGDTPLPIADTMPANPLAAAKFSVSDTAQIYNKIFVSYSRRDSKIAENYRLAQIAVGHDVFMDSYSIRAGENWQAALASAIDESDIFQLFWSKYSSASKNVRDEWDYALNYRCFNDQCVSFIRPVYWENPLIDPPSELAHLNFRFVPFPVD